jgi:type IV pilus assembly protein PilE
MIMPPIPATVNVLERAMRRAPKGVTLVELLVVIAVIGILAMIAYPSYEEYVRRANRSEAKTLLLQISAEQEKFFSTFNRYSGSIAGARTGNPATSGLAMADTTQENAGDTAFYNIAVALDAGNLAYTLTATPQGGQQSVDVCGALTLTNAGVTDALGPSAPDNCW